MKNKSRLLAAFLAFISPLLLSSTAFCENDVIEIAVNDQKVSMVKCPAGTFMMGSPADELGRCQWETQHQVTIANDYYIGKYPVTQEFYTAVMGNNPSFRPGENKPVESTSWNMAIEFCNKLNEKTSSTRPAGYVFALPTEAQWEYACRAGTTTSLNNGKNITNTKENDAYEEPTEENKCPNLEEVGWYYMNTNSTQPVGLKKPNAWGIYDMHGNVSEWCRDWQEEYPSDGGDICPVLDPRFSPNRICRGGAWSGCPIECRSAYRSWYSPEHSCPTTGFRVALVSESDIAKNPTPAPEKATLAKTAPTKTTPVKTATFITNENNVRESPNAKASLIATPAKDEQCEILGNEGKWFKIKLKNGKIGWTNKMNIKQK